MNQVLAASLLFGVVTAVFVPLIAGSGLQLFSASTSVADSMEESRARTGQILAATRATESGGSTSLFLSNIGTQSIRIDAVLVDGVERPWILYDQDLVSVTGLERGHLGRLDVTGTGDAVQVVAGSGKLFEFYTP